MSDFEDLYKAGVKAYQAGRYQQAYTFFKQGYALATQEHAIAYQATFLFCQAEAKKKLNQAEEAIALALQAIALESPEINLADQFNAMILVINIAINRQPAAMIRKLFNQGEAMLEQGKTAWRSMLYQSKGNFLLQQGDFKQAYQAYLEAWQYYKDEYPYYLRSTHLNALCLAAFYHHSQNLDAWVEKIIANQDENEECTICTLNAQLLLARSQKNLSQSIFIAKEAMRRIRNIEGDYSEDIIAICQIFSLLGFFSEAQRHLADCSEKSANDRYAKGLAYGDLHLNQAREALKMALQDDVWDEVFPVPDKKQLQQGDKKTALEYLEAASGYYQKALPEAQAEDVRLETEYYSRTLNIRLQRLENLKNAIEECNN